MKNLIPTDRKVKWFSSPVQKSQKIVDGKPVFSVLSYFTSDAVDKVGDIITREATTKAVEDWRKWGNIRLMHQPNPVGKITRIGERDGLEWNQCEVKVVDPHTQLLIEEEVLKAMSVGIIVKDAEPVDGSNVDDDQFWFLYGGMKITEYDMVEISFVDNPAQDLATITSHTNEPMHVHNSQHAYVFKVAELEKADEGSSEVQTLVMNKDVFETRDAAVKWAADHDFKHDKVDETENSWRLRQFNPDECREDTFGTKQLTEGVNAVFCVRKSAGSAPTAEKQDEPVEQPEAVTESQDGPKLDLGRKSVDETEKQEVIQETIPEIVPVETVPVEKQTETPAPAKEDKLDTVIELLQKLLDKQESVTEVKPEQPQESEPKVKLEEEVVEPKDGLDKKLEGLLDKVTQAIAESVAKQQQWTQEYIAGLNTVEEGKAQVKQIADEPAPEPTTPDEIKKAMRAKLASIFESKHEVN